MTVSALPASPVGMCSLRRKWKLPMPATFASEITLTEAPQELVWISVCQHFHFASCSTDSVFSHRQNIFGPDLIPDHVSVGVVCCSLLFMPSQAWYNTFWSVTSGLAVETALDRRTWLGACLCFQSGFPAQESPSAEVSHPSGRPGSFWLLE